MFYFLPLLLLFMTASPNTAIIITPNEHTFRVHQRAQWKILLPRDYANPFDPDEIAVDARFVGPDGRELVVPAFWFIPGRIESEPTTRVATDEQLRQASFTVRFVPPVPGAWSMMVKVRDTERTQRSAPIFFEVKPAPPGSRGFVRRSPKTSHYFQFHSGEPFFMIGPNLCWANERGIAQYDEWFEKLTSNGGNFARIWMSRPNQLFETKKLGVNRYDQDGCAFYDALFETAERHGVHCMLTFNNYRDLVDRDMWGPAEWPNIPHNAINGGPCTRPTDFINSEIGQKLYRNRLRYIVARWSAYTSVACWEFWNEQTFTNVDIPPAWTRDMARYLKSIDPHQHLVSTSFGANSQHEVWAMPEIDLAQEHQYFGEGVRDASAPISAMARSLWEKFDKPSLIAEFGIAGEGSDIKFDPDGIGTNMHNGMWASMMSGSAGVGAMWWWDNYIDPKNLWYQFYGISQFAKQIDWINQRFEPVTLAPIMSDRSQPEIFADLIIRSAGGWGKSHGKPIAVLPNGQTSLGLPQYIYGTEQPRYRTQTILNVGIPQPTKMVVRVGKVSDAAVLRVVIDGEPTKDFAFSGLPGAPGQTKVERHPEGKWQAEFHQDCELEVPAGKHVIELRNEGNDWLAIEAVTFRSARSSQYADLETYAMKNEASGDVIAWLHDSESNWFNDRAKKMPRTISGARLNLSVQSGKTYRIDWWDTWKGRVIESREITATGGGELQLEIPPVHRDIALRATRIGS
ncbi:MAG: DUF5060 domain-containing protein [Anaerolineae bacterium]|nr:DUF5060 domain-containing protein [Phycisphaerae bacterium]